MAKIELAGQRIEANQPDLDAAPELRQDVAAHRMPGNEVRVVLHLRRDDVVAVAELREQRVHDGVVGLGRAAHDDDLVAAARSHEAGDVVVGRLEPSRRLLRSARLPAVHVLVLWRERPVQPEQLARRLGTGGVVGDRAAGLRKDEVIPYRFDGPGGRLDGVGQVLHLHVVVSLRC